MKVYLSKINESWVVDRMRAEWYEFNHNISTENPKDADLVWIISPWMWRKEKKKILKSKQVICSIYHLQDKDYSFKGLKEFQKRDEFVDFYHVISKKTGAELKKLTDKKIFYCPFWVNQEVFFEKKDKDSLRKKYDIPIKSFVVGSFQRDTEGSDLISPKLIKGPDRFAKIVKTLNEDNSNLRVLLTGKRRQYIISRLEEMNIRYVYLEMVDFNVLNDLYNTLDLYIVSSRIEGGPQAIVECGITKTPIISTNVGIASEILDTKSIYTMNNYSKAKPDVKTAYENSLKLSIPHGFTKFREIFESLVLK
jgi:glycosyltransferase involved in cell wall biosynthesis